MQKHEAKHVVIIGAGFAGLWAAKDKMSVSGLAGMAPGMKICYYTRTMTD